jgi:CelD/BcsL family acetyltransferase involved in cellulose biosynthesis
MFVESITSQEGVNRLEQDWNRLSQASNLPNVFTTFDWFRVWNERFANETRRGRREPNILVLRKDGAVVGISPLVRTVSSRAGFNVRILEFVGRVADYNDLVVGDGSAEQIEAVVDFLTRTSMQWDIIHLRHLRGTSGAIERLKGALGSAKLPYRIGPEEEHCPYMPIDAPWSEMVEQRSPSSRRAFRKQQSRLDRLSTQGLQVRIVENPEQEPGLLERMAALDVQKQARGKLTTSVVGKYPEVFRSLFEALGSRGWFSVALMELGERLLAWQIWFRCGHELWGYQMAHDHSFARLSPGTMLVPAVIDYGFARGFRVCDFLRGDEQYKSRWTSNSRRSYRVQIRNRRWTSRLRGFAYFDLWPALRRRPA